MPISPQARLLTTLLMSLQLLTLEQLSMLLLVQPLLLLLGWRVGLTPLRQQLRRLLLLDTLMLLAILPIPVQVEGTVVLELGHWTLSREGCLQALILGLRLNALMLLIQALLVGLEPAQVGQALRCLRLPGKFIELMQLSLQQIELLARLYTQQNRLMRARGWRPRSHWRSWRIQAWSIALLLLRALDLATQQQRAMRARGFCGQWPILTTPVWQPRDLLLALPLAANALLLGVQFHG